MRSSARHSSRTRPRRLALASLALLLAPACAVDGSAEFDDYRDPIFADVYLHNAGAVDLELRVHNLAPELELDCDAIAADPSALASSPGFDTAPEHLLAPGDTMPARDMDVGRPCHAALVHGAGQTPVVIFWFEGQFQEDWVEGRIEDLDEHRDGAVLVRAEAGEWRFSSVGGDFVHPVALD